MNLLNHPLYKFDYYLPIYNWYYPTSISEKVSPDKKIYSEISIAVNNGKAKALYFHIPFCQTICSFCPFTRGKFSREEEINNYVDVLIKEIEEKTALLNMVGVQIETIFFGGGTPSLLSVENILRLGTILKRNFDLTQLREFSFEMEVKSVTPDKLNALREIGVTHSRFGLQTFNSEYRKAFALTAIMEDILKANSLCKTTMPYSSFDILYGMHGQSDEDFINDIENAISLGSSTIDFYPINNYVVQQRLLNYFNERGLLPKSGAEKFRLNMLLREFMEYHSYLPHNGHGYVKVSKEELSKNSVVTKKYSFKYHEYVYGYEGMDIIGFGNGAISKIKGFTLTNESSREKYMASIKNNKLNFSINRHDLLADSSKPVILHLPYHGEIDKALVDWDNVNPETKFRLSQLIENGLIDENSSTYKLTKQGWYWYVNMMYYLSPKSERETISNFLQINELKKKLNLEALNVGHKIVVLQ